MDEGIFARIPLTEVTLTEAAGLVEDPSYFESTRIAVLFHFPQVSLDGYWSLTVGDHRDMVDYLVVRGFYVEAD